LSEDSQDQSPEHQQNSHHNQNPDLKNKQQRRKILWLKQSD